MIKLYVKKYYGGFTDSFVDETIEVDYFKKETLVIWLSKNNGLSYCGFVNLLACKSNEEYKRLEKICYELRLNFIYDKGAR